MSSLYDADILLWSEQQADLLRRLARGERVDDAVDWENLIEEVGDVGRSEFNSLAGLLQTGLTQLLLAHASRRLEQVGNAKAEVILALAAAARCYAPSMGPRLDLGEVWSVAVAVARDKLAADGGPESPLPENCPFVVEDLVRRPLELGSLLVRLGDAAGGPSATR
uniref:DUF29 family protein n=1 Tax=uncultured Sphingomonas sp. TaxID=158754 RepID=UPI0025DD24E9|nr:DUF29 family protein [uncultured Sphingomonas sp.]